MQPLQINYKTLVRQGNIIIGAAFIIRRFMKNSIWVSRYADGLCYSSTKPTGKNNNISSSGWWYDNANIFDIDVKFSEAVEVIIDTETQKYEVKRPREIGWYLVECKSVEDDGLIFACHWDGENWNPIRNKNKWRKGTIWKGLDENEVTVHSEKLPYNEYLKSLE